ncbi:metabotropic glutamate receptor 4-like protein [Dinothrombium tinctorium]|uniref:Metabotropic glutamate receptor 4-like protein n=1 Tax=Dinothrombium tinctorium TaxID=1965070 RepID=A0A3S3NJK3_9ACAR|nr:metabotropic glutamate receptor 4-like protein [Dinothrombium tinctorium]
MSLLFSIACQTNKEQLHIHRECNGTEKMSYENGYEAEKQLQFVSDAVLAFGYAFKQMHQELCHGVAGLCQRMSPIDGTLLLKYLKNVQFKGLSNDEFRFVNNGDGPVRYNLLHFKQVTLNSYQWIHVGTYEDGKLNLDLRKVQFRFNDTEIPTSVCSFPCQKGQAKKYIEGENCCWHCFNCTKYQILITETECSDCPDGFLPDAFQKICIAIPEEYIKPNNAMAVCTIVLSSVGILMTIYVVFIFLKYRDTPVVRASGRELCMVLLAGILMCFGITFILFLKPSSLVCGLQQTSIGVSFSIVYSAIMTKTNRISRIFNAGKKTTKRPSFISPKSQIIICCGLVLIQLIITLLWFAFSPPKAINYYPNREDNQLVCAANISPTYFIAFCYPIILIVICTVYAVLTRKIPEAFNESKYIGFTMYTTCVIWLAFIPIYFTTKTNISLNLLTMSIAINLSAIITLICLFTPKLYIILLHPEKNIRQSMMSHKQGISKNNFSTLGTSSSKVEIETQSNGEFFNHFHFTFTELLKK